MNYLLITILVLFQDEVKKQIFLATPPKSRREMGMCGNAATKKNIHTACKQQQQQPSNDVGATVDRSAATAIPRPQAEAQQAAPSARATKMNSIGSSTSFHFCIFRLLLLLQRSVYAHHSAGGLRSTATAADAADITEVW